MEKVEHLHIVGKNEKWCSLYGKQYRGSSKKLKIELPCDPAISFLSIYSKKLKSGSPRDICTPTFICMLSTDKNCFSLIEPIYLGLYSEWGLKGNIVCPVYFYLWTKRRLIPRTRAIPPIPVFSILSLEPSSAGGWTRKCWHAPSY